jgi:hypothetical protein
MSTASKADFGPISESARFWGMSCRSNLVPVHRSSRLSKSTFLIRRHGPQAAVPAGIGFHDARIGSEAFAFHKTYRHAGANHGFEKLDVGGSLVARLGTDRSLGIERIGTCFDTL